MTKYKVIQGFGGDSCATIIVADRYTFSDSSKVARFYLNGDARFITVVDKAIAVFTDVASITVVDGAASSPIPAPMPPLLPPTWPWRSEQERNKRRGDTTCQ